MENELRVWRARRKVTQEWLAKKARVSQSRVSNIENGMPPTVTEAGRFARVLETTPELLFPSLAPQTSEANQ